MGGQRLDEARIACDLPGAFAGPSSPPEDHLPVRVDADPSEPERGLAKLVLTVIELLRQLLERQALRRMEAGTLPDEDIERMGTTFMRLQEKMQELKAVFGLQNEDLNLSLGPLGNLM